MALKDRVRLKVAVEMLGVEDKALRRAISRGEITGYRLPGSNLIYVDLTEIEAAMKPIVTVQR